MITPLRPIKQIFLVGVLLFYGTTTSNAQLTQLLELEKKISKKIEVGMNAEEVKRSIGRPKAIEGGFPKVDNQFIFDMPDQAGQLNNSTWFYFYDIVTITKKTKTREDDKFFLNNVEVTEGMYNDYKDLNEVYLSDSSIIFPIGREQYQKQDPAAFSIQPKNRKQTYSIKGKAKTVVETTTYLPIFCVIFDKGTQVVAATKFLFRIMTL